MDKVHIMTLSSVDRNMVRWTISAGTAPARVTRRARVLLTVDARSGGPGWEDAAIAYATEMSIPYH